LDLNTKFKIIHPCEITGSATAKNARRYIPTSSTVINNLLNVICLISSAIQYLYCKDVRRPTYVKTKNFYFHKIKIFIKNEYFFGLYKFSLYSSCTVIWFGFHLHVSITQKQLYSTFLTTPIKKGVKRNWLEYAWVSVSSEGDSISLGGLLAILQRW
jgi:hypothetical protein